MRRWRAFVRSRRVASHTAATGTVERGGGKRLSVAFFGGRRLFQRAEARRRHRAAFPPPRRAYPLPQPCARDRNARPGAGAGGGSRRQRRGDRASKVALEQPPIFFRPPDVTHPHAARSTASPPGGYRPERPSRRAWGRGVKGGSPRAKKKRRAESVVQDVERRGSNKTTHTTLVFAHFPLELAGPRVRVRSPLSFASTGIEG